MEEKVYTITKIEGEYATMTDDACNEIFIALSLLPFGADMGSRIKCENFEYTLI